MQRWNFKATQRDGDPRSERSDRAPVEATRVFVNASVLE
jgi:hypothetical protein